METPEATLNQRVKTLESRIHVLERFLKHYRAYRKASGRFQHRYDPGLAAMEDVWIEANDPDSERGETEHVLRSFA